MKSGYDQFFKNARKVANGGKPVKIQSDDTMVKKLRTKLSAEPKKKPKKGIAWKLAGVSFAGLLLSLVGLQYHDKIEHYVKRIEISLGTAVAEEKPAPKAETDKDKKEKSDKKDDKSADAAKGDAGKADTALAKKDFTPDEINHFLKLNERKRELDAREEELNRSEAELVTQKAELEKRLADLEQTRKQISTVLEDKVQADDKKIDNLVQMYSNMKAQQAAKIFESMDEDLAVEIISRMKRKPAAEIMNLVKAEKAQVFSEKYTGYKRK